MNTTVINLAAFTVTLILLGDAVAVADDSRGAPAKFAEVYKAAHSHFERGEFERALELLDQLKRQGSTVDAVSIARGRVLERLGRCAEAIDEYHDAERTGERAAIRYASGVRRLNSPEIRRTYVLPLASKCPLSIRVDCPGVAIEAIEIDGSAARSCKDESVAFDVPPGQHTLRYTIGGLVTEHSLVVPTRLEATSINVELPTEQFEVAQRQLAELRGVLEQFGGVESIFGPQKPWSELRRSISRLSVEQRVHVRERWAGWLGDLLSTDDLDVFYDLLSKA